MARQSTEAPPPYAVPSVQAEARWSLLQDITLNLQTEAENAHPRQRIQDHNAITWWCRFRPLRLPRRRLLASVRLSMFAGKGSLDSSLPVLRSQSPPSHFPR